MLSPGRWRARSKIRYAPATAAPVSTAPCRFPHRANSGTISQMRFDGARDSDRSSSTQAANSGRENSWARMATIGPKQAGRSSSSAMASARSFAPARLASRASRASVPATAATWAICSPRLPTVPSSANTSSPSTGTLCQPARGRRRVGHAVRDAAPARDRTAQLGQPRAIGGLHAQQGRNGRHGERREPARARQGAQRIAAPRESAHGSQPSGASLRRPARAVAAGLALAPVGQRSLDAERPLTGSVRPDDPERLPQFRQAAAGEQDELARRATRPGTSRRCPSRRVAWQSRPCASRRCPRTGLRRRIARDRRAWS